MERSSDSQVPANTEVGSQRRARVLVAEDDDELRELVALLLRAQGHDVLSVADGTQLVRALAQASVSRFPRDAFDLIVTDVRMPGTTGLEAIARLREVGYSTPVIAMTAFPDDELRRSARQLDVMVLDKPFKLSDLQDASRYFLAELASY